MGMVCCTEQRNSEEEPKKEDSGVKEKKQMRFTQSFTETDKNQYMFGEPMEDYTSDDGEIDIVYKNIYELQ